MIETVPQTGSTNADLAARLARGERVPEGQWLVADRQTAGRGRHGREWIDGAGNFMGSTPVYPTPGDPARETLALVVGLAVRDTIAASLPEARLKWPNDVMLGSAKLAGVLLERAGEAVIVGVGVNLAWAPAIPDRPAVAIAANAAAPPRDDFARALAAGLAAELDRWRAVGLAPLLARWVAAAHPLGTELVLDEPGGARLAGRFAGLDPEGALLLRLPDGGLRPVRAGEVRLAAGGGRG